MVYHTYDTGGTTIMISNTVMIKSTTLCSKSDVRAVWLNPPLALPMSSVIVTTYILRVGSSPRLRSDSCTSTPTTTPLSDDWDSRWTRSRWVASVATRTVDWVCSSGAGPLCFTKSEVILLILLLVNLVVLCLRLWRQHGDRSF